MSTLTEVSNSLNGQVHRLLSDKPLWLSIIVYTAFTGLAFGLVYLMMHLLILRWWVAAIVVVAVGITWGYFTHKVRVMERGCGRFLGLFSCRQPTAGAVLHRTQASH